MRHFGVKSGDNVVNNGYIVIFYDANAEQSDKKESGKHVPNNLVVCHVSFAEVPHMVLFPLMYNALLLGKRRTGGVM